MCAKDARNHNHTIAKNKRSEGDLSDMALKAFKYLWKRLILALALEAFN
jgi:hypothetical protein